MESEGGISELSGYVGHGAMAVEPNLPSESGLTESKSAEGMQNVKETEAVVAGGQDDSSLTADTAKKRRRRNRNKRRKGANLTQLSPSTPVGSVESFQCVPCPSFASPSSEVSTKISVPSFDSVQHAMEVKAHLISLGGKEEELSANSPEPFDAAVPSAPHPSLEAFDSNEDDEQKMLDSFTTILELESWKTRHLSAVSQVRGLLDDILDVAVRKSEELLEASGDPKFSDSLNNLLDLETGVGGSDKETDAGNSQNPNNTSSVSPAQSRAVFDSGASNPLLLSMSGLSSAVGAESSHNSIDAMLGISNGTDGGLDDLEDPKCSDSMNNLLVLEDSSCEKEIEAIWITQDSIDTILNVTPAQSEEMLQTYDDFQPSDSLNNLLVLENTRSEIIYETEPSWNSQPSLDAFLNTIGQPDDQTTSHPHQNKDSMQNLIDFEDKDLRKNLESLGSVKDQVSFVSSDENRIEPVEEGEGETREHMNETARLIRNQIKAQSASRDFQYEWPPFDPIYLNTSVPDTVKKSQPNLIRRVSKAVRRAVFPCTQLKNGTESKLGLRARDSVEWMMGPIQSEGSVSNVAGGKEGKKKQKKQNLTLPRDLMLFDSQSSNNNKQ